MGEIDNKQSKTVCSQMAMTMSNTMLVCVMAALQDAYDKASTLAESFTADYEGEATDEVQMFLESLPVHIHKLMLLYYKMAQFIQVTSESFQTNDISMVQNMEN